MSQAENAAIEVNTVASVADELMKAPEQPEIPESTEEVISEDKSDEVTSEDQDEPTETQDESDETQEGDELTEPESEEPEEDQTETYKSVSELAEAIDMPLEDFLANIKSTVKINGEEQEVSLNDLKNGYQMESDYRRKTTELAEQRKTFEQEAEQSHSHIQTKLQEVDMLSTNLENQLMNEFNSIDWNQLENTDREEWLVQRQKFGEKHQQINQIKTQAQAELNQYNQTQQLQQQEALNNHLAKEQDLVLTSIPEWSDPDAREADLGGMRDLLSEYGFSSDEANQIYDHRIIKLVRDSFRRQSMSEKVDVTKKIVRKLPKIVKAGAKVTKQDIANQSKNSATDKFMKSGSRDDLVQALFEKSK